MSIFRDKLPCCSILFTSRLCRQLRSQKMQLNVSVKNPRNRCGNVLFRYKTIALDR